MSDASPHKVSPLTEVLLSSARTQYSVLDKINSVAHIRIAVNDLVAFEYVCEKTKEWKWGLGTVAAIPGPRLVQLMLWAGSSEEMPPENSPISNADRAEAVKKLEEVQKRRQEAEEEMEDLNKTLTVQHAYYNQGRAAYEAKAVYAEEAAAEAHEEVKNLGEADWREIRSYVKPPEIVQLVTEALMLILGERIVDWNYTLKVIRQRSFSKRLVEFDSQSISLAARRRIRKEYLSHPRFTHKDSMEGSRALGIVQRWVAAQLATSEAKVNIMEYDKARVSERKQIEKLEGKLRQRRNDVEEYKNEELRLKTQLGDLAVRLDYDRHMKDTPKTASAPLRKLGVTRDILSPRTRRPSISPNDSMARGRPGAPPLHENIHGSANTWIFTDKTKIVLHSSILVNYDKPASTVMVLTPEQMEQLLDALKARAVLFAEQQRVDDKNKEMQDYLENLRGALADALLELADSKALLAAHGAELAAKDREATEDKKATSTAPPPADTNKTEPPFLVELENEPADRNRDLGPLTNALEDEKKKPKDKKSAGKRGGVADVELEREPVMNIVPLNDATQALHHARDDRQLEKIIDRLEKEIYILRNESESAHCVLEGVQDIIRATPELKQYIEDGR
ncbi:hypothetical protein JKF63_03856 [Porcisia hertigi]|uniref:Dynein heavy chain coiled coil stalk domain-containing protein n=1 Tax=Porcisia hertigi TaxID=2761500 RepID=A0A836IH96_9TRYP|nr:hypothetical protein JKF63_03856 [Porcisia hertigi]